ncbi:MAG: glutamate synthase [Planctomycetaceae bacterium]|nr:glutamate synthase [Planctomycetaceae bacterium]MBP61487.1 glutamate synthase [Planctomycetaceae bacterium]
MTVYDLQRIQLPILPTEFRDRDDSSDTHFVPAPCQVACPVGTDAPSYIGYIWEGKLEKAFEAITATNPFSSICGRVCDAPCEPACRRSDSDGPVQIRNLKRHVMDELGASYRLPQLSVTQTETVGIIGGGPAGLTAANDLCAAGYTVHVYEMTDRLGGMMVWGIPAFRLPPGIIQQDIDRLTNRCEGLHIHLNSALGEQVTLDELKSRHNAVLMTIGAWRGKPMGIPGEDHPRVVDGVGFLRRVNGGERPELPETVVVIGGGDVAMDACRVAKRLPGCKHVKVIYRRGPDEIPARRTELEGAIEEGIEFIYHTQQVAIESNVDSLVLRCVRTELGDADEDGRRRPVAVTDSEHDVECGMVIASVGQQTECNELSQHNMMAGDRINTTFEGMCTSDPKVFAAGDGAFGGSTIVMAMHHGQRAAYYVKAFLEGRENPLPYRTPYRTRRVPVAQDIMWEKHPVHHPEFFGLGEKPVDFPEIEATYNRETALAEAARCYRCDAETGSADYAVRHREDLFSMARTGPTDLPKLQTMLQRRLPVRDNPYPPGRPPNLDDIVFLPANLSRLVIDPYREACKVSTDLAGRIELAQPFLVTGFDQAPVEVRDGVGKGLAQSNCGYVGTIPLNDSSPWFQLLTSRETEPSADAAALLQTVGEKFQTPQLERQHDHQILGLAVSSSQLLEESLQYSLEQGLDMMLLDGTGQVGEAWPELHTAPDFGILRDAVAILRRLRREEEIALVYFGGIRSGTDAAKVIGLGTVAVALGVCVGLAVGGQVRDGNLLFSSDSNAEERAAAVVNILKANASEASMMARCTGKTNLHNLEPEDLRSVTISTASATGIPLVGTRN